MSSRVLKKLHGEKDLASGLGLDGMSESDDGDSSFREKPASNRFELLKEGEGSPSDTEAKEDDDRDADAGERKKLEKQDSTHSTDSLKRRKKKKKKRLRGQRSTEENLDDPEDEIEASLRNVGGTSGEPEPCYPPTQAPAEGPTQEKSLFHVDPRNLNPDNEMKKIFGSRVVQGEQSKRRGRGRAHVRTTVLVSPKNWPQSGKSGLSMRLIESGDGVYYFTFEHSKQYQSVQLQFLEAVESFNPDNIVALLNLYPSHIDALIQFSDICRMGDDTQTAAELIERALHCLECSLHPLFNVTQGNCRLDYRRIENRSFFIALFKHILYISQRGCHRTALEFCKFLLGLSPEDDPVCCLLMVDLHALRSRQYAYLVRLFLEWEQPRNLRQLPNFALSVPLAMFLMAQEEGGSTEEADTMLQDTLIMFPGVLLPLLERCRVEPDVAVRSHPLFNRTGDHPPALRALLSLYESRCHPVWRAPEVMSWLERQVHVVMRRHDAGEPIFAECEKKRKLRYSSSPRNVLRHFILSDARDAQLQLPQDVSSSPIFAFDPLPPTDSISPYDRTPTRRSTSEDSGLLSMFFTSLLPSVNVAGEGAGARGGAGGADLRRSVTSLIEAVRDLLGQGGRTADDLPDEADVDSDEREQDVDH